MNPETPTQPDEGNAATEWDMTPEDATIEASEGGEEKEKTSAELQAEYDEISAEYDRLIEEYGEGNVPEEKWRELDERDYENRQQYMDARMREVAELIPEKHREAFLKNRGFRMFIDRVEEIIKMHNSGMSAEEIKAKLSETASDEYSIEIFNARVDHVFEYLTE